MSFRTSHETSLEMSFEWSFQRSFDASFRRSFEASDERSDALSFEPSYALSGETSFGSSFERCSEMSFRTRSRRSFLRSFPASFPRSSEVSFRGCDERRDAGGFDVGTYALRPTVPSRTAQALWAEFEGWREQPPSCFVPVSSLSIARMSGIQQTSLGFSSLQRSSFSLRAPIFTLSFNWNFNNFRPTERMKDTGREES